MPSLFGNSSYSSIENKGTSAIYVTGVGEVPFNGPSKTAAQREGAMGEAGLLSYSEQMGMTFS